MPYIPPISANQIHEWSTREKFRSLLPAFVSKLIQSTVKADDCPLSCFPSGDSSQLPGWDGALESRTQTKWVPKGESRWELSTRQDVDRKANSDYKERTDKLNDGEGNDITYVCVSSKIWPRKKEWAKKKRNEGKWQDVKAFDAEDLEQWLASSFPAQEWFAEQLGIDTEGFETLDEVWESWVKIESKAFELSEDLFEHAVSLYLEKFNNFLYEKKKPSLLSVSADSTLEALAFLYCLFNKIPEYKENRKQILIASKPDPLIKVLQALPSRTVLIARKPEAQEVFGFASNFHRIVISTSGSKHTSTPVVDVPVNRAKFKVALKKMGARNDYEVGRYLRESGCSPTILRRRLSSIPEIRRPKWVTSEKAKKLIPFALIGTWNDDSFPDCETVSKLAHQEYREVESTFTELLDLEDSPVWTEGKYRGVVSRKDALFAVAKNVTKTNIFDFFNGAKNLLSENIRSSTNFSVPENIMRRFNTYHHSYEITRSVCESLVLLAIHGKELFGQQLGNEIEHEVNNLIRHLLTPLTHEKLIAQNTNLKKYSEAAPEAFLNIIEAELDKTDHPFSETMLPILIEVLQSMAWEHLESVSTILAKLSFKIEGHSSNMPFESLSRIYCSWFPQTNATLKERIRSFKRLAEEFPDTARRLLVADFSRTTISTSPEQFSWRNDPSGSNNGYSGQEGDAFLSAAFDVIWDTDSVFSFEELCSLVKRLHVVNEEYQQRIWKFIDKWGRNASNADKAHLREQIRQHALFEEDVMAREAYKKLEPQDPIHRYLWLFHSGDIPYSPEENLDYAERQEQIDTRRQEAINEIFSVRKIEGVFSLLDQSESHYTVGETFGNCIRETDAQLKFVQHCFAAEKDMGYPGIVGLLRKTEHGEFLRLLKGVEQNQQVRLFRCAPFSSKTWCLLDHLEPDIRREYWETVEPEYANYFWLEASDRNVAAKCFLDAERLPEAFLAVILQPEKIETSLLKHIIFSVAKSNNQLVTKRDPSNFYLEEAYKALRDQNSVTDNELAFLEFSFLHISTHQIPNLERKIANDPEWFAKAIVNRHNIQDKNEERLWEYYDDSVSHEFIAEKIRWMLRKIRHFPHSYNNGNIDAIQLQKWIKKVQEFCKQSDERSLAADKEIGNLLSKSPEGHDGEWPAHAVCEAMELCQSEVMGHYFKIGVWNDRGVHVRGLEEGGDQERELAAKFRKQAEPHEEIGHYFVATLLKEIAQKYYEDATDIYDPKAKIFNRTGE